MPPRAAEDLIILPIAESEIESCDVERLRFLLDPPTAGRTLLRIQNCVCLIFPNAHAAALADPSARDFSRALFAAFPGCAFYLSLGDAALWKLAIGLMDELVVIERQLPCQVRLRLDGAALSAVVANLVEAAGGIARRAGADALKEEELSLGIWDYFRRAAAAYTDGALAL